MTNFNFWRKWLLFVGVYLAFFGLFLTCFSQSKVMDYLFNQHIDPLFWGSAPLPQSAEAFQGWIYGVLGAVVAGWGTLIAFWAAYPFKSRQRWAWNGLTAAVAIWYIADTAISAQYGISFNVVFNTVVLLLLATPLALTKRYFTKPKPRSAKEGYHG